VTRPLHLERRGAVYYVRIRVSAKYTQAIEIKDFKRSLATKDYLIAKQRCNAAVAWFQETVERMARAGELDREGLEEAANAYFAQLVREVDQPRDFPAEDYENTLASQIEATEGELARQDDALTAHAYSEGDKIAARAMLKPMVVDFDLLGAGEQHAALNHVVRARRQQMRYALHALQTPANRFMPDDDLFGNRPAAVSILEALPPPTQTARVILPELTLESISTAYDAYLLRTGRQGSTRDETSRVLRWLQEEIEPATPVSTITHDQMREFRDCLLILGTGAQGRKLPFRQRLAVSGQDQLKFVTRQRYWRFTTKFFGWLQAEYRIPDPTKDLPFEGGRNELREPPEPFSKDELTRFLQTPLFSGYKSHNRMTQCHTSSFSRVSCQRATQNVASLVPAPTRYLCIRRCWNWVFGSLCKPVPRSIPASDCCLRSALGEAG